MVNNSLLNPANLCRKSQSLAILDSILCPEWEFRYFSFNQQWAADAQMASMRDGQGSEYFILFKDELAAIKGTENGCLILQEHQINTVKDSIPSILIPHFLEEPAFSIYESTFLYWFNPESKYWDSITASENSANELLSWLISDSDFYKQWALEYYELDIDSAIVNKIFEYQTITLQDIRLLNNEFDFEMLIQDINEIGYPVLL